MTERTLRMGGYQGPPSVHTRAGRILGREFLTRAGEAWRFEFRENVTAEGRPSMDLFDMVEGDELDICYFASSYQAHRVPDLAVFDLPFTIDSREDIYEKLDGKLGRLIAERIAENTGFLLLGYWDNGFRHFSNRMRAMRAPEDCAGLSIRTMNSAVHQATFRALGFEPRFIDVKDFPQAVRTGAVDAQENPLTNTVNFKVHETHPHLTMTGHFHGVTLVLGNRARIESWPKAIREALREAVAIATQAQRGFALKEDHDCLKVLAQAGVEVLKAEEFDRDAFVAATARVVAEESGKISSDVLKLART
jgi:C4-dicarboxylate-binding protein DctP